MMEGTENPASTCGICKVTYATGSVSFIVIILLYT